MTTTTSKRPTDETMTVLFDDQIERGQRESFRRGRKISDDNPYSSRPPVAVHEKHLARRVADEAGVTPATGTKYVTAMLSDFKAGLVRIECDANTGEIQTVMGLSPASVIAHIDTLRLHVRTQVHLNFDGFLLPPGERANTYARGGRNRGVFAYIARLDELADIFRERSAAHYEAEEEHAAREQAREDDFDVAYPGLRDALTRICGGDLDELDAIRGGNHHFIAERKGGHALSIALTADGIARLAKALGL